MEDKEHSADYSNDTWLSLLGLLSPSEFFITVDHSQLWRKHVAWSKPDGKDLRNYTAQRFSSSMVFLSLILAAEMNVMFNSSLITTDIRTQMMNGNWTSVKYWIGCVILLSAVITVIALVSTFTAWGMVSSIGDKNAHCLLRSSIGQLVTSLPSNYVLLSLYLFLIWLVLFIVELTTGPVQIVLLSVVMILFFQTVVSLSAFGRLILHTGAMGSRPVLDPALEKALLPSGLHASLLIKATDRKRRRTSVMSMYKTPNKRKQRSDSSSLSLSGDSCRACDPMMGRFRQMSSLSCSFTKGGSMAREVSERSSPPLDDNISRLNRRSTRDHHSPPYAAGAGSASTCSSTTGTQHHSITTDEEEAIREAVHAMTPRGQTPKSDVSISSSFSNIPETDHLLGEPKPRYGLTNNNSDSFDRSPPWHDVHEFDGSMVSFPRPSILNSSMCGSDLKKLVEDCCSISSQRSQPGDNSNNQTPLRRNGINGPAVDKVRFSFRCAPPSDDDTLVERQGSLRSIFSNNKPPSRRSILNGFRQASKRHSIQEEWNEEVDIRAYYDQEPPAQVVFDDDGDDVRPESDSDSGDDEGLDDNDVPMPHPSILNKTRRLKSLRRLAHGSSNEGSAEVVDTRNDSSPGQGTVTQANNNRLDLEECGEEERLAGESVLSPSPPPKMPPP